MRIVKLHTTSSTNDYVKNYVKNNTITEDFLVWAEYQTKGRGQIGTSWEAEAGKSLTFSIFRTVEKLQISDQFYATMAASLAVKNVLQKLLIKNVAVKWPNDILAEKHKICGILIESLIKKGQLSGLILGVGLNINQTSFSKAYSATSIKKITGVHFDLEELLQLLIEQFKFYVQLILQGQLATIKEDYLAHLFRKDVPSTFERPGGSRFTGIIRGVSDLGKLIVEEEDAIFNEYSIKEIQLLY